MNKQIDQQIKNQILGHYQKPFHLLKEIETGYPKSTGRFGLNGKQYTTTERGGFSGTNSIILVTQAIMVSFISNVHHKRIPELQDVDLPIEEVNDFANKMMISRYQDIAFKRPILRNQEQPFTIEITIDKVIHRPSKGLIFFRFSYDICNGSFTGKGTVAHNENKARLIAEKMESAKAI